MQLSYQCITNPVVQASARARRFGLNRCLAITAQPAGQKKFKLKITTRTAYMKGFAVSWIQLLRVWGLYTSIFSHYPARFRHPASFANFWLLTDRDGGDEPWDECSLRLHKQAGCVDVDVGMEKRNAWLLGMADLDN
jgi:hypothetical protein